MKQMKYSFIFKRENYFTKLGISYNLNAALKTGRKENASCSTQIPQCNLGKKASGTNQLCYKVYLPSFHTDKLS